MYNGHKAIVTISTIEGYHGGEVGVKGLDINTFSEPLQEIEENKFADSSISWLVTLGKSVYKTEWGAPVGGEDVFVLQADYTIYDVVKGIDNWKRNILTHIEYLKNYFKQETVRVTFINNVETLILK